MSRIHPKKGLINLIRAWDSVHPRGWELMIAGPDDGGHINKVLAEIKSRGLSGCIHYLGEVNDEDKVKLLYDSNLFILPTLSENFGLVIAEALACGLPVITTKGAPWRTLEEFQCGWWIDLGEVPLINALREATSLSNLELMAMGKQSIILASNFEWEAISKKMINVYRWVLGHSEKPDCVETE